MWAIEDSPDPKAAYRGGGIILPPAILLEFWAYFHRACAETAVLELPVKNLTPPFAPATSIYKTDAFPLPSDVHWIYSMLLCYITSHDLVTLTFDLLRVFRVQCTVLLMSDPHTDYYYPTPIGY